MAVLHFNEESFQASLESGDTMVVDFWAEWCGPCKMLGPTIDKLAEEYEGKAIVGKVDVDAQQALAAKFGVMSIPTLVYFKDGKEVDRKVGVQPIAALSASLDALL